MEAQEQGPVRVVNLSESDVRRVAVEHDASPEGMEGRTTPESVRAALIAVLPKPVPAAVQAPVAPLTPAEGAAAKARVDSLVQMAVSEGIDAAHAAAAKEEPFVLDALHDALAGALYEELRTRGQL